jgi:hypothetical protein
MKTHFIGTLMMSEAERRLAMTEIITALDHIIASIDTLEKYGESKEPVRIVVRATTWPGNSGYWHD